MPQHRLPKFLFHNQHAGWAGWREWYWTCPAFADSWFLWLMVSEMNSVIPS